MTARSGRQQEQDHQPQQKLSSAARPATAGKPKLNCQIFA
jgi:hypothetical protein